MPRDRLQRQRFEQKYILTEAQAQGAREFVSGYLELDENGVGKPHYSYPVHSLYLDSGLLDTFWATINGDKNRYKLRLRFYDNHEDTPVFFEIKRRLNSCILKQRGGVRKDAVPWLLNGHLPEPAHLLRPDSRQLVAIQHFLELVEQLHASPTAHVAYLREAYVDPVKDSVRVTFDRQVRAETRRTPTFSTQMETFSQPFGDSVILELKFTDRYPAWFQRLIQRFGLMQCGAAKYCEGLGGLSEFEVSHAADFRGAGEEESDARMGRRLAVD
jgi:hypothetical protein